MLPNDKAALLAQAELDAQEDHKSLEEIKKLREDEDNKRAYMTYNVFQSILKYFDTPEPLAQQLAEEWVAIPKEDPKWKKSNLWNFMEYKGQKFKEPYASERNS